GIEKLINRKFNIDDEVLTILEGWLAPAPDAADATTEDLGDPDDEQPGEREKRREESILWGLGGVSVLPHGNFPILEAIIRIHLQRKDYERLMAVLQAHLQRTEQVKVWAALLRLFPYIQLDDKSALEGFYRTLFAKYPKLSTSHEAIILFAHIHW